jgi:uncharacterized RDD family membrane protein YckC
MCTKLDIQSTMTGGRQMQEDKLEYVGFWARLGASLIDTFLLLVITWPLLIAVYGWSYFNRPAGSIAGPVDFLLTWILPAVLVIACWGGKQATPGKLAISARIVDAATGKDPSLRQMIGRYFAYFVSTLPFGLGFLWIAFDRKKQGWHDKLAGTVVVKAAKRN